MSRLMVGFHWWLRRRWKCLIPTLPKYPGWYLSRLVRWWCYEIVSKPFLQPENQFTNLTTGHTTTTGVLPVFANTTMSSRDMAAVLPRLRQSSRHVGGCLSMWMVDRCWMVVTAHREEQWSFSCVVFACYTVFGLVYYSPGWMRHGN